MKNNKMNKYMVGGLLINTFFLSIKHFIEIPDSLACFAMGIGLSLLGFGIYAIKHDTTHIENWKRNLLKSFKI